MGRPASIERRLWLVTGVAALPAVATVAAALAQVPLTPLAQAFAALCCLAGLGGVLWYINQCVVAPVDRIARYMEAFEGAPPTVPQIWQPLLRRISETLRRQHHAIGQAGELERLHTAMFNASPNALVISDRDGRIMAFNPSAERVFRLTADRALTAGMSDLIALEGARPEAGEGNVLNRLGERLSLDGRRGDGTLFPAEISILRVQTEGQTRFAAYILDLTEQRNAVAAQTERQQRIHQSDKISAMGSLLAGVAHELNNPLAILVTQATLLRDKAPTPDILRRAERIHAAAQRAGRIVKSFLAMARQKAPVKEPVALNAVVEAALELVGYGLRSAGITVERRFDPDLPPVVADRDLMGQVFANLILNAQQALVDRAGDGRITIATSVMGDHVIVTISDNGPGVADAIAEQIFDPYYTTKPAGAGTGIGLSISRSVVEAHDGAIILVPDMGEGAIFQVSLPAIRPADPRPLAHAVGKTGLSILIVDDEIDVAWSLAELLDIFGHRTVVLASALDALERIRQQSFDVVFTDLRMPGMNGLTLRHAIRSVDAALAERTIIMTGDTVMGPQPDRDAAVASDGFILEKPFSADDVRTILDRVSS